MKDVYLTDKLKSYYLDSFQEALKIDNEFWSINPDLITYLEQINKNEFVQSLYSKRSKKDDNSDDSYLIIAYKEEVEKILFRKILPYFVHIYNEIYNCNCYYFFNEPSKREIESTKEGIQLKCVNDPEYFNINNIRITLENGNFQKQDEFWNDLSIKLSSIEP